MTRALIKSFAAITALMAASLLSANASQLDGTWYISGMGSFGWHNDSKSTNQTTGNIDIEHQVGGGGTGAIGWMRDCWRIELEGAYRRFSNDIVLLDGDTSFSKGHTKDLAWMVNGFYERPIKDCLSLYIGAGIGLNFSELTYYGFKKRTESFAWQLMPGVAYQISRNWDLLLGFRFFSTTKTRYGKAKIKTVPISSNIDLGLRLRF